MIYTVTLNPSVDLFVELDELHLNDLNRMHMDKKIPGGKGINATRVLNELGIPSISTGFLGGFTGAYIEKWLVKENIRNEFQEIEDDTRINIKLFMDGGETFINGVGPDIKEEEISEFLNYMSRVQEGDFVIMGGSYPPSLGDDIYERLIGICSANKSNFIVDIPPAQQRKALRYKPLLIKPNRRELALMFGLEEIDEKDIIMYGLDLIELGAQNAIVSLGEDGALLFTKERSVYRSYGVPGSFVNSVGSRDAMIAGFIGTYMKSSDPVESFKVASSAALATAYTYDLATGWEIREMEEKVQVDQIRKGYRV